MSKDRFTSVISPLVFVTVAACTLGAYIYYKQGLRSPLPVTSTEVRIIKRNDHLETKKVSTEGEVEKKIEVNEGTYQEIKHENEAEVDDAIIQQVVNMASEYCEASASNEMLIPEKKESYINNNALFAINDEYGDAEDFEEKLDSIEEKLDSMEPKMEESLLAEEEKISLNREGSLSDEVVHDDDDYDDDILHISTLGRVYQDLAQTNIPEEPCQVAVSNTITEVNGSAVVWKYLRKEHPIGEEEVNRLVSYNAAPTQSLLYKAIVDGNVNETESLLRMGVSSVDFYDIQGGYPVHLAASIGNIEILKVLIKWGGDLSKRDKLGYTAIHRAALSGRREAVDWLLDQGSSLEDISFSGRTPLHLAATSGHLETVELLLNRGARVNSRDNDGWTPLYLAKVFTREQVEKILVKNGAKY